MYNNLIYISTSSILFRLLYSFDLELNINVRDNILQERVLSIEERIKILRKEQETLIRNL